jgi:hypothetical protein
MKRTTRSPFGRPAQASAGWRCGDKLAGLSVITSSAVSCAACATTACHTCFDKGRPVHEATRALSELCPWHARKVCERQYGPKLCQCRRNTVKGPGAHSQRILLCAAAPGDWGSLSAVLCVRRSGQGASGQQAAALSCPTRANMMAVQPPAGCCQGDMLVMS